MAGSIVGLATQGISDIASPIVGHFAGQRAGDAALKKLRADYAAARSRAETEGAEAVQSQGARNVARVAGAGIEVGSISAGAGIGRIKGAVQRNLDELERQYIERRDAIWDAQGASGRHLGLTAAFTLGGLPLQAAGPLVSATGLGEPFTPASTQGLATAGAGIGRLLDGSGQGGSGPAQASDTFDLPATGGPAGGGPGTILGTRGSYIWYA